MHLEEITDESALSACTLGDDGGNVGVCHAVLWPDLRLEDARRQPEFPAAGAPTNAPTPQEQVTKTPGSSANPEFPKAGAPLKGKKD
jgi:hypothetical protein